jgi:ABC-type multidrug transport system fused ATPase/permease subunit
MSAIQDHPATQSVKDTVVNGPVGETVKDQSAKTSSEFKDLASVRTTPEQPAATGQPLTHYHSLFYRLLSWKNPRATAVTFLVNVLFIFAARYVNVIRYAFKALYIVFGITAAAEIAGKAVLGDGLATRIRPRKYFVIPKESLERFLDDVEQLLNFFVIEFQRVLFAESLWATVLAFVSAFVSYFLIRFVPLWGLTLITTFAIYLTPLVYIKNKEVIDEQIANASKLINQQTNQLKELAAHHTKGATDTVKSYAGDYSKKASEYIGQSRQKISGVNTSTNGSPSTVKASDFPPAPKEAPIAEAEVPKAEPQPEPAY